jgi:hypothetical protein
MVVMTHMHGDAMNRLVVATFVALGFGVAMPVFADIPPRRDYVETCTIERVQGEGDSCVECRGSFQDREACATEWAPQGYEKSCQARGASVWTEIWCRSDDAEPTDDVDEVDAPREGSADESESALPDEVDTESTDSDLGSEPTTDGTERASAEEVNGEGQETAPAEPPARSRGCSVGADAETTWWAMSCAALLLASRRRLA